MLGHLQEKGIIKNSLAYVGGNFVQKVSEFLFIPLWTRYLTPQDYGITGTLSAFSGVLSPFLMMGLYGYVSRFY